MNKPFDPWTATEEEATTAEQRFQMNVAQLLTGYDEHTAFVIESWSDLRLLSAISWILKAGLKAPPRLSEEFDRRLQPILTGEKQDFREWQAHGTANQRAQRHNQLESWTVYFVDKLRADEHGAYTTDIYDENNVFAAARPLIIEKTGEAPDASGLKGIYYDVKKLLKGDSSWLQKSSRKKSDKAKPKRKA